MTFYKLTGINKRDCQQLKTNTIKILSFIKASIILRLSIILPSVDSLISKPIFNHHDTIVFGQTLRTTRSTSFDL